MEAHYILADKMKVCGPILFEFIIRIAVAVVTYTGDIVCKSIEPDIYNMTRRKIHGDSPVERTSRNTEIL